LTFAQYVQNWFNAYAAETGVSPNPRTGDPALAIGEADASQATVLQWMAVNVINFARASTSSGSDLDSWMADFGFTRLGASFATGTVTFSTAVDATQLIYIPVGTIVQTPGAAIQYQVVADNSQPTFNASKQAYYIPIGFTSCNVTVTSLVAGSSYNVQATMLSQLASTIFGISSTSNLSAIDDGTNAETDVAFRARFVDYINSLSKATETAIYEALISIETSLKVALFENVQAIGNPPTGFTNPYLGNIVALVDDGSGAPSTNLLAACTNAVAATVAFGIMYQVLPPAVVHPAIVVNIRIAANPTETTAVIESNVAIAIINYINALPIGSTIWLNKLIQIIIDSDPNVVTVEDNSLTIGGTGADYVLNSWQEALITISNVTVGTF
jgi:phage-related baseplate assembly protein